MVIARAPLGPAGLESQAPRARPTTGKQRAVISSPAERLQPSAGRGHKREENNKKQQVPTCNDSDSRTFNDKGGDASSSSDANAGEPAVRQGAIRPTSKRYFILLMFIVLCALKSFQWVCFASITNVVSKYYRVDNIAINWTAIVFMVTFLILALPVSWLMEQIGLRNSVLIGSLGTTLGIVIKCFSCYPEGYYLSMLGHLLVGFSEPFFFSIYSQISAVWFPDNQVSLATSIGLLGEEIGIALGFIVPSLVVGNSINDEPAIQQGLFRLFLGAALISTLNTTSIALFFDERPQFAPGIARYKQIQKESKTISQFHKRTTNLASASSQRRKAFGEKLLAQTKQLHQFLSDRDFNLLLVGFGLNVGTNYSIRTILNQMIVGGSGGGGAAGSGGVNVNNNDSSLGGAGARSAVVPPLALDEDLDGSGSPDEAGLPSAPRQWQDVNLVVGNAGLILIVAGFFGTVVCGHLLDRFHRYKLTTLLSYLCTLLSMLALTYCLRSWASSQLALYAGCALLGFFITGYLCCGFEYAVEITYPKPELASSTLLNISAQIFGIPLSLGSSAIVDAYGNQAVGLFFASILSLGLLLACLQEGKLRRQTAVEGDGKGRANNSGGCARNYQVEDGCTGNGLGAVSVVGASAAEAS